LQFIQVIHPGAQVGGAPQTFADAVGKRQVEEKTEKGEEGKVETISPNQEEEKNDEDEDECEEEEEKAADKLTEEESKKGWNFAYWKSRTTGTKDRDTPKRTPKAASPTTTTSTSATRPVKREGTPQAKKNLFGRQ
jgi:hypothetical protein